VLALVMGALVFADMAAPQLQIFVPLGEHLVVVGLVMLSLLARWWQPAFAGETRKEAARP
jgi:hypothetical protein